MIEVNGRVGGSIDTARVRELLAATNDEELKAHYREVLGEPAEDKPAKKAAKPADKGDEEKAATRPSSSSGSETSSSSGSDADADGATDEDLDALRAEAEARGVKVDGRWGAQRLQEELDAAGKKEKH